MKSILWFVAVLAVALSGCTSLGAAGSAKYMVKPFKDDAGALVCCEVHVINGKEIGHLKAHIEKKGLDWVVDLEETNIKAFEGQRIVADATEDVAKKAASTAGMVLVAPAAAQATGAIIQGITK